MPKSAVEMVAEMEKAQSHREIEVKPEPKGKSEINAMLAGFEFVPSDGVPFITLDNQRRFYLNTSARRLIGVKPYDRVIIGYRPEVNKLAIIKAGTPVTDPDASISDYIVDKRFYMSARKFSRHYAFAPEAAPYEFVYDRGSTGGDVFIFRLKER